MLQKLINKTGKVQLLIFALLVCWQFVLFARLPNFLWDVGLVIPWFVKNGLKFFVDFDPGNYLPLLKLLMIPLDSLFNSDVRITLYLSFILSITTLTSVYIISLRHLTKNAALLSAVFYSIWYGFLLQQNTLDMSLFMGLMTIIMLRLLYKWIEKPEVRLLVYLGFVGSVAFFSQQMSAVPIAVIVTSAMLYRKRVKEVIFPTLAGFFPITFTVFLYFALNGILVEFINKSFLYFFDNRYPAADFSFNSRYMIILAFLLVPFITSAVIFFGKKKREWEMAILLATIFFIIIAMLIAVQHPRRYLFILPLVSFSLGITYDNLSKVGKNARRATAILMAAAACYAVFSIFPWYKSALGKGRGYEISTLTQPGDFVNSAVNWIREKTPENSRIHVLGPMILYYEAQRLPANNRTYSALPWSYEPFEETKKLFTEKPADYWLVDERQLTRFENWGYSYQATFIRNLLDTKYRKVINYDWMSVYKLK